MDDAIVKGIENLQAGPLYAQVATALDDLDDGFRRIMGQLVGMVIIFSPLIICIVLVSINLYKRFNIETKREILATTQSYVGKKQKVSDSSRRLIATREASSGEQLMDLIKTGLARENISFTNLAIDHFSQNDHEYITRTDAQLTFKEMTLANLMKMVQTLSNKLHIRISGVQIDKDEKERLSGSFDIIYYFENLDNETAPTEEKET